MPTLLPAVAAHPVVNLDPILAEGLCDLLGSSIEPSTASDYRCGFRSLTAFCATVNSSPLPVSLTTLCLWLFKICGRKRNPDTVAKYLSGVRHFHLLSGFEWTLSTHPLVKMVMRGLRKRFRKKPKFQKVPLSLGTLLAMCRSMPGWPKTKRLSFKDLLFATASSIAFSAGLRGGEFFTYHKSSRPLLRGKDVMPASSSNADLLIIDVPKPKNRPFAASARTYANGSTLLPEFHPSLLLKAYRKRALALGLNVLHKHPAFQSADGSPLTRDFMVHRAEKLRERAGLNFLDVKGKPVFIYAASWRAGFVLSAQSAGVDSEIIDATGRWDSKAGRRPYTFDTITTLRVTADRIAASHIRMAPGASQTGGQFVSDSLIL